MLPDSKDPLVKQSQPVHVSRGGSVRLPRASGRSSQPSITYGLPASRRADSLTMFLLPQLVIELWVDHFLPLSKLCDLVLCLPAARACFIREPPLWRCIACYLDTEVYVGW